MMHHDAGVKTVVVGGLPHNGPMQTASGTRGAQLYTAENIDDTIAVAKYFNATTANILPDRDEDVLITFLGVNLRDQIRKEQEDVPVQFVYDAADCRMFYTFDTWSDYSQLWTHAVKAAGDSSLCVAGSTGFSSTGLSSQAPTPPPPKPPTYNVSALLGTSNQFTNTLGDQQELDDFQPNFRGVRRAVPETCNNYGKGCTVGRCISKTNQGRGEYNHRIIDKKSGVCPVNGAASTGLNALITKNNEPAEIHGEGGEKKGKKEGSGAGSVAEAIRRPFTM